MEYRKVAAGNKEQLQVLKNRTWTNIGTPKKKGQIVGVRLAQNLPCPTDCGYPFTRSTPNRTQQPTIFGNDTRIDDGRIPGPLRFVREERLTPLQPPIISIDTPSVWTPHETIDEGKVSATDVLLDENGEELEKTDLEEEETETKSSMGKTIMVLAVIAALVYAFRNKF